MTKRIIRAISNPYVTFLAHPTGRLLLNRDGYAVDIPAIVEAAAETGTWIEINAAPKRLDLDWRWWPLAKEKGVKCVINPDAHGVEKLPELWFGVGVARKGWLTKSDVMNCLPLGKIERELRRKRCICHPEPPVAEKDPRRWSSFFNCSLGHGLPLRHQHRQALAGAARLQKLRHRERVAIEASFA